MNAYNYESNILDIKDKYNNHYILQLRGNKTLIKGSSGTGKTYVYDMIEAIKKKKLQSDYSVENIVPISELNIEQLSKYKDKLIIIDRAEFILKEEDILHINSDTSNRYLIFSHVALGLDLSPNHQGDLITENGITKIQYRFNVKGWG